jgi:HlyD family secretion protein
MAFSRNKKILIGSVVLLGVIAIGVASFLSRRQDLPEVQVAKVARRALLESRVTANGEVRPVQFINLTAEVSGRVTDVFVKEGDQIEKGKPLLRVDPTQLASSTAAQEAALRATQADLLNQTAVVSAAENAVNTARAGLNSAQADLERARVERNNAEIELKRSADLLEAGITARSSYDTAKLRFDSSTASLNAAKARTEQAEVQVRDAEIRVKQTQALLGASQARVAQQQANLEQQSDLLRRTTQFASINGVVVGPIVQVGTFAIANFQSTPLLIIADMSVINVEVRVDETDIANVAVGQKVRVKVDALGEQEIEGEVVEKAASAVTRTGQTIAQTTVAGSQEAKDFKVVIRLVNLGEEVRGRLRPGMSATAVITTDRREQVISVPLQALVERESEPSKGSEPAGQPVAEGRRERKTTKGIFTVENNKAIFTPVETGITGENDIEILRGLKEGKEIIIGPYRQLRTLKTDQVIKREEKAKAPAGGAEKS